MSNAPDYMDAIEGWRCWKVVPSTHFGMAPALESVAWDYHWEPRKASEASCGRGKSHRASKGGAERVVPVESCTCGFYTARSFEHLTGTMSYHRYDGVSGFVIMGQVANWGKVIECATGWRSQFAYPVRLFVPYMAHKYAKALHEAYGVPVELRDFLNEGPSLRGAA